MVLWMVCYYYPSCQNQFAEHWQHISTLQNDGRILRHVVFVPHWAGLHGYAMTACLTSRGSPYRGIEQARSCTHLAFCIISAQFKHCRLWTPHSFPTRVENWGKGNEEIFWKDREKFKAWMWMYNSHVCSECPNRRLQSMKRAGLSSSWPLKPLCVVQ